MRLLLSFLVLAFFGCSSPKLRIPPNSRSSEYVDALLAASNISKKYVEFETQIFARGTIYSDGFKNTLTKELNTLYGEKLPDGAYDLVRSKNCTVFISISTPIFEEANISHKENALEIVAIQNGKELPYDTIDKQIEDNAIVREFFPYVNNWAINYFIEFNNVNCNEKLDLIINSPKTKLEIPFN